MEHHGTFVTTFLLCFAHILEAAVISTFYDMENQGKSWKHIRRYDIRLPGSESMAEIETVWHIDIVDPTKASPNVVACGPCGDVTLGETNDLWPRNQGTTRYNKVQQGAHSLGSGHTLLLSIKKQMVWKDADLASCLLNVGLARCCFNEGVVCLVMSGCNVTLCWY